jgi:DNA repair exonuclease SbcCD nuclease subunit
MNGNYVSNQGKWDLTFPQVISGHIHTKQHLQKNIYYTGSSMETEWKDVEGNESNYNTIAVLSLGDNKSLSIEEKEIRLHRKLKVHVKIEDLETFEIPAENAEDQIRVQISGIPYEEFNTLKQTTKYKELIEKDIKVDFEFNKSEVKVNNQKLQAIINDSSLNDFRSIFETFARCHTEPYYHELYELIMNNRVVKTDDIFILKK